VHNLQTYIATS